ncbi:MAG: methyltransferase domain-containing protein [bacterium]|nr:methyltransferase domain-containing protein [bacterium]
MKTLQTMSATNVKDVYNGAEGQLWELVMGEQIHIGGFASSMDLAEKSGIGAGTTGVDFCCCTGAGMRFLARFHGVAQMTGVDMTERMIETGRQRVADEGLSDQLQLVLADVCDTGLPSDSADFVWGEDAWCYVEDKNAMIAEAARLVKPGGTIAFTDWVEGPAGLDAAEAERFMTFMKFPSLQSIPGYEALLGEHGCSVEHAEDTGRFKPHVDLYLNMLNMQLTYDALKIIGWDTELMAAMGGEMVFMQELAGAGKIAQGLFVARKQ